MESFILNIDIQFINFHILISHVSLLCIPILISQKIFLIHKIILYSNWLHKKSIIAPAALSSLHTVPASPQGHSRCCRCHAARHLPGSDCQRRSSPFLPFSASCTMSENLQSSHSSIVFFFGHLCVCVSVCTGVSPGFTPPMWYQKWTHSVLAVPWRTVEVRTAVPPEGSQFAPVLAIM